MRVVVVDATTTSLLPQLDAGRLDLAVVALPVHDPDVETEPLFEEDLMLVTPPDHPLGARATVDLAELADHDAAARRQGTAFRDDLDVHGRRRGVELQTKAEVDGMRLLASLAFEGFGAAVLPASAVPRWYPGDFRTGGRRRASSAAPSASPAGGEACRRRRPGRCARCSSTSSPSRRRCSRGCHLPAP